MPSAEQSSQRTNASQPDAFGHDLTHHPPALRTERNTQRNLAALPAS